MRRASLLLVFTACLQTGDALYSPMSTKLPALNETDPAGIFADAGVGLPPDSGTTIAIVQAGQTISLTFSRSMDPNSLRPGIAVYKDNQELSLEIQAMMAPNTITDPMTNFMLNFPFQVSITPAGTTWPQGINTLRLRTLLVDQQGNALAGQMDGFFDVP
jgi:hypothetical protein